MPHAQTAQAGVDVTAPGLRHEPAERRRKSGPALRAFFAIADRWKLDPQQQRGLLGWPAKSTMYAWKSASDVTLPYDTLIRLSLLLGIFKALDILYPEQAFADGWVKMPNRNDVFGGRAPIDFMTQGGTGALYDVRRLLDARRGGWS